MSLMHHAPNATLHFTTNNAERSGDNTFKVERIDTVTFDNVKVADLDVEQLEEVHAHETKLGVTLVAYEGSSSTPAAHPE